MEIKPCPFCGYEPEIFEDQTINEWLIECPEIECFTIIGGPFKTKEQAIKKWNKRGDK